MERKIIEPGELASTVATLSGWTVTGIELRKRAEFDNFQRAWQFVNSVAALAEEADHHPNITFGWGYAEIALTTHDRGGITDVDIALAREIDKAV